MALKQGRKQGWFDDSFHELLTFFFETGREGFTIRKTAWKLSNKTWDGGFASTWMRMELYQRMRENRANTHIESGGLHTWAHGYQIWLYWFVEFCGHFAAAIIGFQFLNHLASTMQGPTIRQPSIEGKIGGHEILYCLKSNMEPAKHIPNFQDVTPNRSKRITPPVFFVFVCHNIVELEKMMFHQQFSNNLLVLSREWGNDPQ